VRRVDPNERTNELVLVIRQSTGRLHFGEVRKEREGIRKSQDFPLNSAVAPSHESAAYLYALLHSPGGVWRRVSTIHGFVVSDDPPQVQDHGLSAIRNALVPVPPSMSL
jgi:hypothetical protein